MVGLAVPSPLTTTLWLGMHGCGGRVGLRAPPGLCYRPLHDRYDRYNISCTRYVAILVGGPGPLGPFSCFCFLPPARLLFSAGPPTDREINPARPWPESPPLDSVRQESAMRS